VSERARARVLVVLTRAVGGASLLLFLAFLVTSRGALLELRLSAPAALLWDGALSLAFFLQHSLMVRAPVRARLARLVPAHALGALYSIASGLVLAAVVLLWQRVEPRLLAVDGPARLAGHGVAALALLAFAWAVASLRRFDPFGARAIEEHLHGATARPPTLSVHGPYRWVRHPLYLFTLVIVWSRPDLTVDRLLLDVLWTAWILVGTVLEERDLAAELGDAYRAYQRRVPMILPWRRPAEPAG
jgi:methanethiol S-methyltransferase